MSGSTADLVQMDSAENLPDVSGRGLEGSSKTEIFMSFMGAMTGAAAG